MAKGVRFIALLLAYCLAVWLVRDRSWAPPPLLTPRAALPLWRPIEGPPKREAPPAAVEAPEPLVVPAVASVAAGEEPAKGTWAGAVEAFRALEAGDRRHVRVLHLGDSEIVADGPTAVVRRRLVARFGDGGMGFAAATSPVRWYQIDGWTHRAGQGVQARTFPLGTAGTGRFGPGGVAFEAQAGAYSTVTVRHRRAGACVVRFLYDRMPGGGEIALSVDGESVARLSTAGPPKLMVKTIEPARCPRDLAWRNHDAYSRVFGWSVEFPGPGIVYSTLGVVGAQLRHLAHYEPGHLAESLAALEPDLIVLGYGLNLASMQIPPPPSYAREVGAVLSDVRRGVPHAACLIVGPYPVGKPEGSHPEARNARRLTRMQREAAEAAGCAFVDRFHLAGGAMAVTRWRSTYPRILSGDYR
ncbi:MAG: GDSL-type esterase/lipase family protein, partial [Polyangiaceae bacterium]